MLISYPCLTVTCYYPYFFVVSFLVLRVKILFGFIQKNFLRMKGFCDQTQMEHTDLEYL